MACCDLCDSSCYRLDKFRASGREAAKYNCGCGVVHWTHRQGWCSKLHDPDDDREEWLEKCLVDEIAALPF